MSKVLAVALGTTLGATTACVGFGNVPVVEAASSTVTLAQSQVVSITGGYNTTTQVYEQTGNQITQTQFAFEGLVQLKANVCSEVNSTEIVCTVCGFM